MIRCIVLTQSLNISQNLIAHVTPCWGDLRCGVTSREKQAGNQDQARHHNHTSIHYRAYASILCCPMAFPPIKPVQLHVPYVRTTAKNAPAPPKKSAHLFVGKLSGVGSARRLTIGKKTRSRKSSRIWADRCVCPAQHCASARRHKRAFARAADPGRVEDS